MFARGRWANICRLIIEPKSICKELLKIPLSRILVSTIVCVPVDAVLIYSSLRRGAELWVGSLTIRLKLSGMADFPSTMGIIK